MYILLNFLYTFRILSWGILFSLALSGCSEHRVPVQALSDTSPEIWSLHSPEEAKGIVTLLPGLNTHPKAMLPLSLLLKEEGYHSVILPYLYESSSMRVASVRSWRKKLDQMQERIAHSLPNLPRYILGYSLGGLVALDSLSRESTEPCGLLLLSPAIELRAQSYLPSYLTWLRHLGLSLPSGAPALYREKDATPFQAYHQLYSLQTRIASLPPTPALAETPTLLIVHESDELVSPAKMKAWVDQNHYDRWRFVRLLDSGTNPDIPRHIVLDENSLGSVNWQKMRELIRSFLQSPCPQIASE